jgi:FAD/FMN-containing dehydrogenase
LTDVVFGTAPIDPAQLASVLRGVRDVMRTTPRQLAVTVIHPPPLGPPLPPMVAAVWAGGDEAAARQALAPLLAIGGVGAADLHVVPYASTLAAPPQLPPGLLPRLTSSNGVFVELPDATIDRAVETLAAYPSTMLEVRFLGGAFADVPSDATALAWRDAEALVHWISFLPPDATADDLEQAAAAWAAVGKDADALCGTFTDETGPELLERMYPPETLDRLRQVKRTWDPGNLFRRNHNIPPA